MNPYVSAHQLWAAVARIVGAKRPADLASARVPDLSWGCWSEDESRKRGSSRASSDGSIMVVVDDSMRECLALAVAVAGRERRLAIMAPKLSSGNFQGPDSCRTSGEITWRNFSAISDKCLVPLANTKVPELQCLRCNTNWLSILVRATYVFILSISWLSPCGASN